MDKEKTATFGYRLGQICASILVTVLTLCVSAMLIGLTVAGFVRLF